MSVRSHQHDCPNEMNKDDTKGHAKLEGGGFTPIQRTEECWECGRGGLPKGRAHQLVV